MLKHQCPFCFKEMDCDAKETTKHAYKRYFEEIPDEKDIMTGEDIKRMRLKLKEKI